jgi:aspartate aminotransferase-like enzyme
MLPFFILPLRRTQQQITEINMPALLPQPDPQGLLEYSVVYTDRALNHMSQRFQGVMKDISRILKKVYNAKAAVIVPGSGTFGMEAVARQFATHKKVLVIRNGWFSFRWTQIFDMGHIPSESIVLKARQMAAAPRRRLRPCRLPKWLPPSWNTNRMSSSRRTLKPPPA